MSVIVVGYNEMYKYNVKHVIETTSKSKGWSRGLSPFFIGPVILYDNYIAKNVENAWQFSKVYKEHTDFHGNPTQDYFKWAQDGWNDSFAYRYPMGKGSKPLYSWWDGQKLDYIEARKKIYSPLYAKAVIKTSAFQTLKSIHESGDSFVLVDYDGYDYVGMGKTLKDVVNDPSRKMGHAFVLALLLEKYKGVQL